MLVLTLDKDCGVVIGDNIHVVLVRKRGSNRLQIGINAPRNISVVRDNLLEGSELAAAIARRVQQDRVHGTTPTDTARKVAS